MNLPHRNEVIERLASHVELMERWASKPPATLPEQATIQAQQVVKHAAAVQAYTVLLASLPDAPPPWSTDGEHDDG